MSGHKEILVRRCLVLGLAMMFMVVMAPTVVAGDPDAAKVGIQSGYGFNPGVVPPEVNFHGTSYADWSVRWWQWCYSLPVKDENDTIVHPLFDTTGKDAANGQHGNVWFLGGIIWPNGTTPPPGPVTRKITVPAGTALFFPIANGENNYVEVPSAKTIGDLWATMAWLDPFRNNNLYATIDGRSLYYLKEYRATPPLFALWLPEGNLLDYWGYDFKSGMIEPEVADGYYLLVEPLSVGKHTIKFGVQHLGWTMDIIYKITVEAATE
jgi:hypothetical protein